NRGGRVSGGFDGGAALFCEGEERLGGFFGDEGEVDVFCGEGSSVGAAEQEQCLGEVDRSTVDVVEAVDEFGGVAVGIFAGDLEQCLGDRERGTQFVGGVSCESLLLGCESLLLGGVCFQPREHGVEGVGELPKFVLTSFQPDPVR